jgi:hypothetical protein
MPKLIISYRRFDTRDAAGRIRDRLVAHFGDKAVYMDIDNIPPGVDFREHIRHALNEGDVLIAIIGPRWLGPARGKRFRIEDPDDPIRMEIEAALQKNLRIVPVLVNDTTMPRADELPEPIKDFAFRNAVTVDMGQDFDQHMVRLIRGVEYRGTASGRGWLVGGAVAVGVAACGALLLSYALWWKSDLLSWKGVTTAERPQSTPAGTGGAMLPPPGTPADRAATPPAGASIWIADDGSKVYLAAKGQEREFIFHEPTQQMKDLGARPGDLLFEGTRVDDWYEGRAWLYTGGCGTGERRAPYDVKGPVLMPGNVVVELNGQVPIIDPATCRQKRSIDGKLLFESKSTVLKFIERK